MSRVFERKNSHHGHPEGGGSCPVHRSSASSASSRNSDITATGYLKKKGLWGRWKEYYYHLTGTLLTEYWVKGTEKTPSKVDSKEYVLKQEYHLDGSSVQTADNLTGVSNSFAVFLKHNKSKETIFFQASSQEELEKWVTAILHNTRSQDSGAMTIRNTLEAINDGAILSDKMGRILDANEQFVKMFGWTRDDLIGKPIAIIMPKGIAARHDNFMTNYHNGGERRLIGKARKMDAVRKDGTVFPIFLSLGEVSDADGLKFMATIRDCSNEEVPHDNYVISQLESKVDEASKKLKEELIGAAQEIAKGNAILVQKVEKLKDDNALLQNEVVNMAKTLHQEQKSRKMAFMALYSMIRTEFEMDHDPVVDTFLQVKKMITNEIESSRTATTLFREDSLTIKKISAFLMLVGGDYLLHTLEEPIIKIVKSTEKLTDDQIDNEKVASYIQKIWVSIQYSRHMMPPMFVELFEHVKLEIQRKFPESEYLSIVGGILFLRFFTPSVISPDKVGIVEETLTLTQRKALVMTGKVLMNLANRMTFASAPQFAALNKFIMENISTLNEFVEKVSETTKPLSGS